MTAKIKPLFAILSAVALLAGIGAFFALALPSSAPAGETTTAPASGLDVQSMLSERSMGAADAPVVIVENSSLSCPHCSHFHKDVLPKLKTEYIETGKVRLILNDFPLNRPALEGVILARCLPAALYFDFIDLTFSTQETWMNNPALLRQNAKLAGLSEDRMTRCLESEALAKGIAENMQAAQKKWKVASTPTFVFNDGASILTGALPYEDFKAEIEKFLAAKASPVAPGK